MSRLQLEQFERQIAVRPITIDDYVALKALQLKCFPGMQPWSRAHIESQTEIFPEGQICVTYGGQIVASSCSLIVDFDHYEDWQDWNKISDNGYIRNHDDEGDVLYGIEMMVDPEYRGLKLARRLYEARKELVRERNLRSIIIGGRIPGYGKHADEMTAREYVEKVIAKELFDPVLTAQLANGFALRRLIPNYLPADQESRGFATFLEWENIDYVPPGRRRYRAVSNARVCAVQYMMRPIDYFENFKDQVEYFVDTASDYKSDFVVFPELLTAQLMSFIEVKTAKEAIRRLTGYTEQLDQLFLELAHPSIAQPCGLLQVVLTLGLFNLDLDILDLLLEVLDLLFDAQADSFLNVLGGRSRVGDGDNHCIQRKLRKKLQLDPQSHENPTDAEDERQQVGSDPVFGKPGNHEAGPLLGAAAG